MFSGTVTGKIEDVVKIEKKDRDGWAGHMTISERYFDKEQRTRFYVVWIPEFLEKRMDALVHKGKYIGCNFSNYKIEIDFNSNDGVPYLMVHARELFIL